MNNAIRCTICKYINFGSYPQSIVSNPELINVLNNLSKENDSNYCKYKRNKYIKVEAHPYMDGYEFSNNEKVINGNTYWFKVEPIRWRELEISDTEKKLFSTIALDTHLFNIDNNNYIDSEIRNWLNNDFYNTSFSDKEKELINNVNIDCNNDKVYLLSYNDIIDNIWFDNNPNNECKTRQIKVSDYAIAKGIVYNKYTYPNKNCYWWLRSPYANNPNTALSIDDHGSICFDNVKCESNGVCPAITIIK